MCYTPSYRCGTDRVGTQIQPKQRKQSMALQLTMATPVGWSSRPLRFESFPDGVHLTSVGTHRCGGSQPSATVAVVRYGNYSGMPFLSFRARCVKHRRCRQSLHNTTRPGTPKMSLNTLDTRGLSYMVPHRGREKRRTDNRRQTRLLCPWSVVHIIAPHEWMRVRGYE